MSVPPPQEEREFTVIVRVGFMAIVTVFVPTHPPAVVPVIEYVVVTVGLETTMLDVVELNPVVGVQV